VAVKERIAARTVDGEMKYESANVQWSRGSLLAFSREWNVSELADYLAAFAFTQIQQIVRRIPVHGGF
jgi:hypothetical protein